MASLSKLRRRSVTDGEWVTVNEENEPFQVCINTIGQRFHDRYDELCREAARRLNRAATSVSRTYRADGTDLPPSSANAALATAVCETVVVGVAGLLNSDGSMTTLEQFKEAIGQPEYRDVLVMVHAAALVLSNKVTEEIKEAAGN
jgi:hypothetical protein